MRCTDELLRLVRARAEALRRRRERLLQRGAAAASSRVIQSAARPKRVSVRWTMGDAMG